MDKKKIKIAVTGGIGSGKTEFCNLLKEKGHTIISADEEAKKVLSSNQKVIKKVKSVFGENAYKNSQPDIKYLADNVFSNQEKVLVMNSIIHPEVIKQINKQMDLFLKEKNIVFVEAALIYEAEMEDLFDYVVLITSDDKKKIERTKSRSNLKESEIKKRMENQIPDKVKKDWADFVFENDNSIGELKIKAGLFLNILKSIGGAN